MSIEINSPRFEQTGDQDVSQRVITPRLSLKIKDAFRLLNCNIETASAFEIEEVVKTMVCVQDMSDLEKDVLINIYRTGPGQKDHLDCDKGIVVATTNLLKMGLLVELFIEDNIGTGEMSYYGCSKKGKLAVDVYSSDVLDILNMGY